MDTNQDAPSRVVSLENQCLISKSPYIRAHASNATAWQLWNADTFALAKRTNRLILLSSGYASCHWCHVMSSESFSHARIAQLLNEHFIPVKIDREERPDVDRQYMDFLQATTGHGGWPLNVFITPELEPIFGGTYWPGPESERLAKGSLEGGFEVLLVKIAKVWKEQEVKCRESGKEVVGRLREFAQEGSLGDGVESKGGDGLELDLFGDSFDHWWGRLDHEFGGFGRAPKFPTPVHLRHLIRMGKYSSDVKDVVGAEECEKAEAMVVKTLANMWKGAIKDQIGHGFARYSVTRDWSLPHFEKMLYDNAQLLPVYLDAYLLTRNPLFQAATHDIATYLTSEPMLSPLGAIHSSEDADSLPTALDKQKREGAFYVWTHTELQGILTPQELEIACAHWGIKPAGNISPGHDPEGELQGRNTLHIVQEVPALAITFKLSESSIESTLSTARKKLLAHRDQHRPRPTLDDKIVTSWNGLAILGLARTGNHLDHPAYTAAAEKIAACIKEHLYSAKTGRLVRVYRDGPGETTGFADDYAFLIAGLLELYQATFDSAYLSWAETLQRTQISLFWDAGKGGFFSTPEGQEDVLVRVKDGMDGAEPSVNGVCAWNLFMLGGLLGEEEFTRKGERTVGAFEVEIGVHAGLFSGMMEGVLMARQGVRSLTICGEGQVVDATLEMVRAAVKPGLVVLRVGGRSRDAWLKSRNQLVRDLDGQKEMVQLCEGTSCKLLELEDVRQFFSDGGIG